MSTSYLSHRTCQRRTHIRAALMDQLSPINVPGPEEPEQAPPSPDYVPGPELADDEIVAGDQPYAEDASPMTHSPDDVPETDPEADPEEDDDEDPEEDPMTLLLTEEMLLFPSAEETGAFETMSRGTPPHHLPYERAPATAAARPVEVLGQIFTGLFTLMDMLIRRDPERYVGYGITDSWEEMVETLPGAPVSTVTELGAHKRRRAWGSRAMDASDLAHGEVISLRTTVHAQMSEITELQSADHRRQRAISDLLETDRRRREEMREEMIPLQGLVTTLQGQVTALQGQVMALQGQVTALQGQQGPAGGPAQPELPEEAGSSS
ncbi:hypothetical protein Tco_0209653 [Tanacetum coccineum]